jgi:nucleoid-associated protein YgaU
MTKNFKLVLIFGILLSISACSSSQTNGEGSEEDVVPVSDAGTDAVPQGDAEGAAPTDDTAPSAAADSASTETAPSADSASGGSLDAPPPVAANTESAPDSSAKAATDTSASLTPPATATETPAATPPATPPVSSGVSDSSASAVASEAPAEEKKSEKKGSMSEGGSSGVGTHTVQRGDTLMKIAFEVYGDLFKWKELYEANKDKIKNPNDLPVGIELSYEKPSETPQVSSEGEKYLIKQGDTLGTISENVYGTRKKWKKIWKNNRELIKDPNKIFAGFYLYYPMSAEDKEEFEKLKGGDSQQLANTPESGQQMSSTSGQPQGDAARMPASEPAQAVQPIGNTAASPGAQMPVAAGATAEAPPSASATQ